MEGIGGGAQDITWQKYNGVRRSTFIDEEEEYHGGKELAVADTREKGRRFEAEKTKEDRMWTEVTKDLVTKEALAERGYEYEEQGPFYYIFKYLKYVSSR